MVDVRADYVIALDAVSMKDVAVVGGKNASLGEMLQSLGSVGVSVPGGFATTAEAYRDFLAQNDLGQRINEKLANLDVSDVPALQLVGADIRLMIMQTPFSAALDEAISNAYQGLEKQYGSEVSWAVRSSATAEDLPDASFAGQQETFLNVSGLTRITSAIHEVFASLFNDRAIAYRVHQGFRHDEVALSAGVQKMVRSDLGASGVLFTLDTESGFRDVVFVTASYGLGELVVQGSVNPDEFYIHKSTLAAKRPAVIRRSVGSKLQKMIYAETSDELVQIVSVHETDRQRFCISDDEVQLLAEMAIKIEQHYERPMDIEWAKDGVDGQLYIVQARPETVQSRAGNVVEKYTLSETGEILAEGRAVGGRIGSGCIRLFADLSGMDSFKEGDVLLTDMTDPDWEPIMEKAAAIITNRGGRTCHAAIIARELGVPAVVGCGDATERIADGQEVTVSCATGDSGYVYAGSLAFEHVAQSIDNMPEPPIKIMLNVGNPGRAFDFSMMPHAGVGLARLEFIINNMIGIHPKALLNPAAMEKDVQAIISERAAPYGSPSEFYIARLTEGIATIAAAFSPHPVIVRLSDFKSNEYANLIGGKSFEPKEENPMIGFRGASRYLSDDFRECFVMECEAIKRVRNEMGFTNVELMIPFVRTLEEAKGVCELLADNGLRRGDNGLRVIMMCELPTNAVIAPRFLEYFDGFSIGSNDMTQLTLGLDRDSALVANSFDERDPGVLAMLEMAIDACNVEGKYIGICGQGPSDHPQFARWLVDKGINSVSLNPDSVVDTWLDLARK